MNFLYRWLVFLVLNMLLLLYPIFWLLLTNSVVKLDTSLFCWNFFIFPSHFLNYFIKSKVFRYGFFSNCELWIEYHNFHNLYATSKACLLYLCSYLILLHIFFSTVGLFKAIIHFFFQSKLPVPLSWLGVIFFLDCRFIDSTLWI